MQIPRTRHDIRGMCFLDQPLQGGVSSFGFPLSSSASAGPGPLQANANIGLFQVPISASFLNPSATTTYSPTSYYNPTVTQGALSNSLILGPEFGGGQSSSASLFGGMFGGGGGSSGGGGGNVANNINYSPTTDITTNLPNLPNMPSMPNMIQGGVQQSVPFHPIPMPAPNSPMGMTMMSPQPIAAGGVSPTIAAMLASPQQQQPMSGMQPIIPGYDSPPQQQPPQQPGGMPQMQMPQGQQGGGNMFPPPFMAMAFPPQQQGEVSQGSPMPGLRPYTPPAPQGLSATAGSLGSPSPTRLQRPLQGGTGQITKPDSMLDQTRQQIAKEMEDMASKPMELTSDALKQYQKRLEDAQKADDIATAEPEARHEKGEKATDDALADAKSYADPETGANKLGDTRQKNIDSLVSHLSPAMKALYNQGAGIANSGKFSKLLSVVHAIAKAGVAGYGPYTAGAIAQDNEHIKSQKAAATAVYNKIQEEGDKMLTHQLDQAKEAATIANSQTTQSSADLSRAQTRYNEEQNQAEKQTMGVAAAGGTAISHTASVLSTLSDMMHKASTEQQSDIENVLAEQRIKISQQNATSNALRAGVAQRGEARAERDEPSLLAGRDAEIKYKQKLTGGAGQAPIPPTVLQIMGNQPTAKPTMSESDVLKYAKQYGIKLSK